MCLHLLPPDGTAHSLYRRWPLHTVKYREEITMHQESAEHAEGQHQQKHTG